MAPGLKEAGAGGEGQPSRQPEPRWWTVLNGLLMVWTLKDREQVRDITERELHVLAFDPAWANLPSFLGDSSPLDQSSPPWHFLSIGTASLGCLVSTLGLSLVDLLYSPQGVSNR